MGGSLVIGQPGTKTVMRAYDPGTYVWRGPVPITKLRHPHCVPISKRMIADLKDANVDVSVFRNGPNLTPSVKQVLQNWMKEVTSDEAEAKRFEKRRAAALGLNNDGSKKA